MRGENPENTLTRTRIARGNKNYFLNVQFINFEMDWTDFIRSLKKGARYKTDFMIFMIILYSVRKDDFI